MTRPADSSVLCFRRPTSRRNTNLAVIMCKHLGFGQQSCIDGSDTGEPWHKRTAAGDKAATNQWATSQYSEGNHFA